MTFIQLLVNGVVFPLNSRRIICGKSNYRNNENETFWAKCDRLFFFFTLGCRLYTGFFDFTLGYDFIFVEMIIFNPEINVLKGSLTSISTKKY